MQHKKYSLIILAAGASTRMGSPKQLLQYEGQSLVARISTTATAANLGNVFIVLGAKEKLIKKEIKNHPVSLVLNPDWQEGMATSVVAGLEAALQKNENIEGVIFMVCDQPFVSSELLRVLVNVYEQTNCAIVASDYGKVIGIPAFFHKKIFPELLTLKGDVGAKFLIQKYKAERETVAFPKGIFDVDTVSEYESLIKKAND